MTMLFDSSLGVACCSAAKSTRCALRRALTITARNFRVPGEVPLVEGVSCRDLAKSWKECVPVILSRIPGGRRRWSAASALKSCSRLYDRRCPECDASGAREAIAAWEAAVADRTTLGSLGDWSSDQLLCELRTRLRILIDGWGSRLESSRLDGELEGVTGPYFPDQQGCLEAPRAVGGTWSVSRERSALSDPSHLRVGVAKTKGKSRVVTMQSANVKRTLRPVHTALYDHISQFGWCVRGEVRAEDFLAVSGDRREGEWFVSGDYSSATDRIYSSAVEAMVQVLLECPDLLSEEREVLGRSFRDLKYRVGVDGNSPLKGIHRGQMMGNLVSFPFLCLLNKIAFDLTVDICTGVPGTSRVGRFNGDDCLFSGDHRLYETWQSVTSAFGFVVNVSKTGFSPRFGELNSRCFDYGRGRLLPKISLSFLRPVERNQTGDILPGILEGIKHMRTGIQEWIVCSLMRHEISLREISLGALPRFWVTLLLRRRWFRDALHRGAAPSREFGDDRSLPIVLGPLPRPEYYGEISRLSRILAVSHVRRWEGVRASPHRSYVLRGTVASRLPRSSFLTKVQVTWGFLWPERLAFLATRHPEWLAPISFSRRKWVDDHPFLARRCQAVTGDLRFGKELFRSLPDPLVSGIPMGGILFCER